MTLPASTVTGSTRVVVLASDPNSVRGTVGEFRHFGVSLVVRDDILGALNEVVHDPTAVIVVPSDLPCPDITHVLDLAVATCKSTVLFGLHPETPASAVSLAVSAGAHGVVELPITPERLTRALRTAPHQGAAVSKSVSVGDLVVDIDRYEIRLRGTVIHTTPREFDVLVALATAHPRMVTLDELAQHAGGSDPQASVRVMVARLRTRFSELAGVGRDAVIETLRGVGYRLAT